MLGKLFKHEIRATAKTFMWLYIAFVVIVTANAVFGGWSPMIAATGPSGPPDGFSAINVIQGIFSALYVLSILAMGVVTIVVVILRFFRNLLGDEGYLMMTLPVSREKHVLSKLFVALIWTICTSVLIFLSILMLIASTGNFTELAQATNEMTAAGVPVGGWAASIIVMIIVGIISGIMMLYAAMAVGPNLIKNRVGGSILAYIIICVASQIISSIVFIAWASGASGYSLFQTITETAVITSDGNTITNTVSVVSSVLDFALLGAVVSSAVISLGCWFLTMYMLKRKLNLA